MPTSLTRRAPLTGDTGATAKAALGDGKALQFGLAPLQHADILQQPFQTVAVKRLNNFGLDEANGSGSREGVLQPANRPLPRLLLKANAEFHKPISNALGLGEFMSEFVLHLLQLLGESEGHAALRIMTAAIIGRARPKIKD